MAYQHRLLIGGIGDDAHSVGIGLLALGFKEAGFYVKNLGIRNSIDAFFKLAEYFDVIMISNKNGHAELYLENFQRRHSEYALKAETPKLWYLGGSLSVSESDFAIKKKYLGMGFTNVYPRPIAFENVLDDIQRDLYRFEIPKRKVYFRDNAFRQGLGPNIKAIRDRKWTREELEEMRKEVLTEWPTGNGLKDKPYNAMPAAKVLDNALQNQKENGKIPLFQPRTGVADIEDQITLLQYLESKTSDISSVQLDAACRSRMYDKAQEGIRISRERNNSALNGFPISVYGVEEVHRLISMVDKPFQLRGGGPDHRFTYEIALKAGITAVEGGFICYNIPYDKLTTPVDSLTYWQYIDRLAATYFEEHGIRVNREYFGVLTATLINPSTAIAVNIIQALLSAQQGITSISVGYAEQGNRAQDVATIQAMKEACQHYLNKFGYTEVRLTTVFHQFMAAFPADKAKAEELIFNSSISATLAGANKVMVKTAVEAIKIPDRYDNGAAVQLSKKGARSAHKDMVDWKLVATEKALILSEVKQIMDVVLELGNGSPAVGAVKAIDQGIIDVPWAPNIHNFNKVVGVRDKNGAVRYWDTGNLPFDERTRSYHFEKVEQRKTLERDSSVFSLLEKDLSRIWKNDYKAWPLDQHYVN